MAIKKKTNLRARSNRKTLSSRDRIEHFKREQAGGEEHENPLLKLSKTSKKEKQQARKTSFTERLASKVTFNLSGGISKSAKRRRNRKEREQLKPKMHDLFSSLPEVGPVTEKPATERREYVESQAARPANTPNAQKHTGHAKLLQAENEQFSRVLSDQQFQQSPFAALRQVISQRQS